MIIDLITGHETFRDPSLSSRINCFYQKDKADDSISVYSAAKDAHSGITLVNREYREASNYNRNFGSWCSARFDVVDGGFITVNLERKTTGTFSVSKGQILLLAREQAALIRMEVELTGHPKATASRVYIEGRFDVILPDRFADIGVVISDRFIDYYDPEAYSDFVNIKVLEKEMSSLTKIKRGTLVTKSGDKLVVKRRRGRKLRLDIQ